MSFVRPTLQEIIDRIETDFMTRIEGGTSLLRRSVLKVMARVYGGAVHLLYEFLDYHSRQLFAASADTEGLESLAAEWGLVRTVAAQAVGTTTVTGTNGSVIPAGTKLESSTEQVYSVDAVVTISAGTGTLALTAVEGGTDGNEVVGVVLTFVSPITGVYTETTVDSGGLTGGADEETDSALRSRLLLRKRYPPHGGCQYDYENWALEYSGVTRVWVFPLHTGVGTVGLTFVMDNSTPYIPNEATRALVKAYIVEHEDPMSGRTVGIPITAEAGFTVFGLTELSLSPSLNIYPNTSVVQALIQTELEDMILRDGGPGQTIRLSRISEAISLAEGEEHHLIVSPVVDISVNSNEIYKLGTVTFNDY